MPTNYPGGMDTTGNLPTNRIDSLPQATNHPSDHDTVNGAVLALEAKVGTGSSIPTAGLVLTATGTGTSAWQATGATAASGGVFAVRDYGASGNGSTDDTTFVQNAINAAAAGGGGSVLFAPGTYSITQVTIPAVEIQFQGNGAATLLHRVGLGGAPMLINASSTVCPQFTMEDLTIDGNMGTYSASTGGGGTGTGTVYTGGQPEATVTITLTFGAGATFRNCRFLHSRHHALDLTGGTSRILLENCTFTFMAEWGGGTGVDTTPLRFNGAANIYDAIVQSCSFEHPTPLHATYNPGAIIVDVQGTNQPVRLNVDTCRFKNIGQSPAGTFVGNVYIYRAAGGSSVTNCIFETPYFTAVAIENSSDFIVQGNRVFADANLNSHVFSVQGNERWVNVAQARIQFANNTVQGSTSNRSEGVYIDSTIGTDTVHGGTVVAGQYPAMDILVADNMFQQCRLGVTVANMKGVLDIHDNQFRDLLEGGYGRALLVQGSLTPNLGVISFHDNYCDNLVGNPVACDDVANPGLSLRIENNTFNNVANNDAGLQIRGVDEAIIRGNKWLGTPTAGSIITLGGTNSAGRVVIDDNVHATLSTITRTLATSVKIRRNTWQPIGDLGAVTVPATTVESGTQMYDCTVYIFAGTVTVIAVGPPGGTQVTGLQTAGGTTGAAVRVNAGNVIKMTYSAAPTWKWIAD